MALQERVGSPRQSGAREVSAPALHELSAKGREIVLEYYEIGYQHGRDAAEAEHWGLPTYQQAVDALIEIGTLGINRREAARRREVA